MRNAVISSGLLMARAFIIGVMPSVQVMPRFSNSFMRLMSMKSTPIGWSPTPASSRSFSSELTNLLTCWSAAGPTAPLIQA